MSKGQYEVMQQNSWTDIIPMPTTHTVVITDRATGEEYKGSATTVEKAEEVAWEKIRDSQDDKK